MDSEEVETENASQRRARAITARRDSLGLTRQGAIRRSGVSHPTWERLEDPGSVRTPRQQTLVAAARALQWPLDALVRIGNGEDPSDMADVPRDSPPLAAAPSFDAPVDRATVGGADLLAAAELLQMIAELPPHMKESVVSMIRELHGAQLR
jgi:hypothetical protein